MMKALKIVACAGVCLLLCGCPKNQVQSRGAAAQPTAQKTYSHDEGGLEQQFGHFLAPYSVRDADSQRRFAIFAIPEAGNWFATYFPPADVEQLGWDYEAEVDEYRKSLLNVMSMWPYAMSFRAHCSRADKTRHTDLQPRADAIKPIQEVPVESFEIEFVSESGRRFSQLANFVYVSGAYRYVGKGAYPFWSMPDATRK
jgi:hypothetical protein